MKHYLAMDIKRILELIAAGNLTPLDLASPEAMKIFRYRGMLKDELLRSMNRTRTFAVGQVRDELRRQGVAPR